MTREQLRQFDDKFYHSLKLAVKPRNIKLSPEHDIYKKEGEYFYHAFYSIKDVDEGKACLRLAITVKYHRFDELQHGIVQPGVPAHFTDKTRAVCCQLMAAPFEHTFECDGSDDPVPALCEQLLDFLQSYCADYIKMADNEYGGLNGYYIANKENNPGIAGLAYLDRGDINGAIECFSSPRIEHCKNVTILVDVKNHKQLRRVLENGNTTSVSEYGECTSRRLQDLFNDYAVALQNGLEWNYDRAMFGLLKKERNRWSIFSIIHRILKVRSRTETCGNA